MLVKGGWPLFSDGTVRPAIEGAFQTPTGAWQEATFLLDAGADRTVLHSRFLPLMSSLALPASQAPLLAGVGGQAGCIFVQTRLRFVSDDQSYLFINGPFGIFTDAASSDISVLGRDVTNNFDVIYSYRKGEVLLRAPPHRYSTSM